MSTFVTDTTINDLYLDAKKNIAMSRNRLEEIQQLVNNKLQTFLGEIALDTTEGVDYFGVILDKFVPLETKLNELTNKILEVDGVQSIENIDYSLPNGNDEGNFSITIKTDAGTFTL